MLKFRTEAEFERWRDGLKPEQRRRVEPPRSRAPKVAAPTRARAARKPGFRAQAERAAAWFFVTVVGLSAWGLSLCVFGLIMRSYP